MCLSRFFCQLVNQCFAPSGWCQKVDTVAKACVALAGAVPWHGCPGQPGRAEQYKLPRRAAQWSVRVLLAVVDACAHVWNDRTVRITAQGMVNPECHAPCRRRLPMTQMARCAVAGGGVPAWPDPLSSQSGPDSLVQMTWSDDLVPGWCLAGQLRRGGETGNGRPRGRCS